MKTLIPATLLIAACGSVNGTNSDSQPDIAAVTPDRGPSVGGATITVTGQNLDRGTPIILVGGRLATNATVVSAGELTFTLPPGAEGDVVDVTVANDNGFDTEEQFFTYNFQPIVVAISPQLGRGTGGTAITLTGRGFQADDAGTPTITIGGGVATDVVVVDDTTITASTGPVVAGTLSFTPIDVVVDNANGSGTLAASFRVTSPGLLVTDRGSPSRLFHVDLATGAAAQISTLTAKVSACALNLGTNVVFGKGRDPQNGQHTLVSFDPLTGVVSTIGPLDAAGVNHGVGSMAFNGNALVGMVASCCSNINRVATINTTTGAVTLNGTPIPGLSQGTGIATRDATTVFSASRVDQSLDTITIATSARVTGLSFSGGNATGQPLPSMVNLAGTLFVLERNNPGGVIYRVDPATAVLVKHAEVSTNQLTGGMCQAPSTF